MAHAAISILIVQQELDVLIDWLLIGPHQLQTVTEHYTQENLIVGAKL